MILKKKTENSIKKIKKKLYIEKIQNIVVCDLNVFIDILLIYFCYCCSKRKIQVVKFFKEKIK